MARREKKKGPLSSLPYAPAQHAAAVHRERSRRRVAAQRAAALLDTWRPGRPWGSSRRVNRIESRPDRVESGLALTKHARVAKGHTLSILESDFHKIPAPFHGPLQRPNESHKPRVKGRFDFGIFEFESALSNENTGSRERLGEGRTRAASCSSTLGSPASCAVTRCSSTPT